MKIVIVDYQLSNLFSVMHACNYLGLNAKVSSDGNELLDADAVILPGVGAFGDAMKNLKRLDLEKPIKDFIFSGKPFMGICLGLQLLFEESEEFGKYRGLSVIKGSVKKFPENIGKNKIKIPHIGWAPIQTENGSGELWSNSPLKSIKKGEYMYFVHSYYVVPSNNEVVLSSTHYEGINFCSSIIKDNIFAAQFHPEKSAKKGLDIYSEWAKIIKKNEE